MLDIFAIVIISAGFFLGFRRGLIKTIFDAASILIGIVAAIKLSPVAINILEALGVNSSIAFVLGIAFSFAGIMMLIRFIGKKVEDFLKAVNINIVNRISGGAIQALFFAVILSYGVHLLDKVHFISNEQKAKSKSYTHLQALPEATEGLFIKLKPLFITFWQKTEQIVKEDEKK